VVRFVSVSVYVYMYVCNDSAAPAHARTRAHRPAAPRQSSGVSQTPQSHGLSPGRHSTHDTIGSPSLYSRPKGGRGRARVVSVWFLYTCKLRHTWPGDSDSICSAHASPPLQKERFLFTHGLYTEEIHVHTHRELIREWLWEPKGSCLEYIQVLWGGGGGGESTPRP